LGAKPRAKFANHLQIQFLLANESIFAQGLCKNRAKYQAPPGRPCKTPPIIEKPERKCKVQKSSQRPPETSITNSVNKRQVFTDFGNADYFQKLVDFLQKIYYFYS